MHDLSAELIRRVTIDQEYRRDAEVKSRDQVWRDRLEKIDRDNTSWLSRIVTQFGWPTVSLVGKEASYAAWLLVQHADHNLVFQRQCLSVMKQLSTHEIDVRNVAYLEDRVLMGEKKPQLYGTQFIRSPDKSSWILYKITDPENIDQRRTKMNLPMLVAGIKEMNV